MYGYTLNIRRVQTDIRNRLGSLLVPDLSKPANEMPAHRIFRNSFRTQAPLRPNLRHAHLSSEAPGLDIE
jgi:hypothetical protein